MGTRINTMDGVTTYYITRGAGKDEEIFEVSREVFMCYTTTIHAVQKELFEAEFEVKKLKAENAQMELYIFKLENHMDQ